MLSNGSSVVGNGGSRMDGTLSQSMDSVNTVAAEEEVRPCFIHLEKKKKNPEEAKLVEKENVVVVVFISYLDSIVRHIYPSCSRVSDSDGAGDPFPRLVTAG